MWSCPGLPIGNLRKADAARRFSVQCPQSDSFTGGLTMDTLTSRKSARWLWRAAAKRADALWQRARQVITRHFNDGCELEIRRGDKLQQRLRLGPNSVFAFVTRRDNSIELLGETQNLLTNIGRDVFAAWNGGGIPAGGSGTPATACGATSITATGTPWTASNLATPQLGLAGFRVYASVTGGGTAPVYGNIISNTTSVATIDKWWNATDGTGATPANTNGFIIGAGGIASVRFMALTANSSAASASDTTLASEITTNGCQRVLAAYAHTQGAATYTISNTFTASGTQTVAKLGIFSALSSAGADPMFFEDLFGTSASLISGDTVAVTDTCTISG